MTIDPATDPVLSPFDAANRQLLAATHPAGWQNPTPEGRYNLVVIGGGTAGLVTAGAAAMLGARVALVERHLTGGDCLTTGCVPSKLLLRSSRAVGELREAPRFGVSFTGSMKIDFPAIMTRMREVRAQLSVNDSVERFQKLGVDVYLGEGRFTAPDAVQVEGQRLSFSRAVISTGSRPAAPSISGLSEARYLTNETIFSLTELPRRICAIGGGPVNCELAQAFARFGASVTIVESGPSILPQDDRDAAACVAASLRRDGVTIATGAKVIAVTQRGSEKLLTVERNGASETISVDAILVSVGRRPVVDGLGLEAAGVTFDPLRGVTVDDHLRTTNPRVFAAGDVCSELKFTHLADAMARIVVRNSLLFGRERRSRLVVPWCTYTDPELAHVRAYDPPQILEDSITREIQLTEIDRAVLDGTTEGFLRLHVAKRSGKVLAATLVARNAGDMISELTLGMTVKQTLAAFSKTIHPYPTVAEIFRKAGDEHFLATIPPWQMSALRALFRIRR